MSVGIKSKPWMDNSIYPFKSHYFKTSYGRMHYIDEGKGEVILFVHGTPTWSFLYRKQILELSKTHRCIAIDHIGFGLSDKPKDFEYHPKALADNLASFIEHLRLKDITMVVHDFGGPIGLPYTINNSENIKRLVLFNTWLWSTSENKDAQKIDKVVNTFLGRWLYLYFNFSAGFLLKNAFDDKSKLSKQAKKHYKEVFPSKNERYGPYKIAQQLIGASDFYAKQWEKIEALKDKPTLIIWGTKDNFITTSYLSKWISKFPGAEVVELNCGHFPQEERTDSVNQIIKDFITQ